MPSKKLGVGVGVGEDIARETQLLRMQCKVFDLNNRVYVLLPRTQHALMYFHLSTLGRNVFEMCR
jgi:hypothetical protein